MNFRTCIRFVFYFYVRRQLSFLLWFHVKIGTVQCRCLCNVRLPNFFNFSDSVYLLVNCACFFHRPYLIRERVLAALLGYGLRLFRWFYNFSIQSALTQGFRPHYARYLFLRYVRFNPKVEKRSGRSCATISQWELRYAFMAGTLQCTRYQQSRQRSSSGYLWHHDIHNHTRADHRW